MQLYRKAQSNGAEAPWDQADEWVFEVNLDWWQFLIGGGFYDGVLHLSLGPLTIIYFRDAWRPRKLFS
jgi:hypothetical protein